MRFFPLLTVTSLVFGAVIPRDKANEVEKQTLTDPIYLARDVASIAQFENGADDDYILRLWADRGFRGKSWAVYPSGMGIGEGKSVCVNTPNVISSVQLFRQHNLNRYFDCFFYDNDACSGQRFEITSDAFDLKDYQWNDRIKSVKCWWIVPFTKRGATADLAKREDHAIDLYSKAYYTGSFVWVNNEAVRSGQCKFISQDFGVSSIAWNGGIVNTCIFFTSDHCDGTYPYFAHFGGSLDNLDHYQDVRTGRPWNDMIRSVACFDHRPALAKRGNVAVTTASLAPAGDTAVVGGKEHALDLYKHHSFLEEEWVLLKDDMGKCASVPADAEISSIQTYSSKGSLYTCTLYAGTSCDSQYPYVTWIYTHDAVDFADWKIISTGETWDNRVRSIMCQWKDKTIKRGVAPRASIPAPQGDPTAAVAGSDHAVDLYHGTRYTGQFWWYTIDDLYANKCVSFVSDAGISSVDFPSRLNGVYCHLHVDQECSSEASFNIRQRTGSLGQWDDIIQSIRCWIKSEVTKREAEVPAPM